MSPTYRLVKDGKTSKWICSYHVVWPEEVKFLAKDISKSEASYKAALTALNWLKTVGKITEHGTPIIYDKQQVNQITKKSIPSIVLSSKTDMNIQKLVKLYEEELLPTILSNNQEHEENNNSSESSTPMISEENNFRSGKKKIFLGMRHYTSKEKIELPISKYK